MPRRPPPADPVPLVLYEDPLSPWCLVAERRIAEAANELPGAFLPLVLAPFPTRHEPRLPSDRERRRLARDARKAAKEPEATGITPELWLSPDPPLSSLPVLVALAAARQQGKEREQSLRARIREAALVRGVNVSRTDVLLELAERAGVDSARFATAMKSKETERRVRRDVELAVGRGIDRAPALVIGEEWLVPGPRPLEEYRSILRRYADARCLGLAPSRTLH